jgi:hypothetical protein
MIPSYQLVDGMFRPVLLRMIWWHYMLLVLTATLTAKQTSMLVEKTGSARRIIQSLALWLIQ